ncbi:MAG: glycosyltransferase [Chloroflexi bacterium]|nr:glycosyltransferase [Chloroflexota bacterium]
MGPVVSVVVPTHRRPRLLERCLGALCAQTYPASRAEVIVVEDGGHVGTPTHRLVDALTRSAPVRVRYLAVPRRGPAAARNAGWRAASGGIIAFTDDDALPDARWLEEGVRACEDGAEVVSGRTLVPLPARPTDAERNVRGLERATFVTCNAFCRRSRLEAIGGFDPRFEVAYREDSDLEFGLLESGARIVRLPQAVVVHPARAAPLFSSLGRQRNQQFDALLYRKHRRLFRAYIRRRPPVGHYLTCAALTAAAAGLLTGHRRLASACSLGWTVLTLHFLSRRLRGTRHAPADLVDMLVTSVLIPPSAVFWRLRGACRFRTLFL